MTDVLGHLMNLVGIPSPSSMSNRPMIDYAIDALRSAHWQMQEVAYIDSAGAEKVNLIAAPPGQRVEMRDVDTAFVCHTDTVPFAPDWIEATNPSVENGMLRGCGACDVKGFLACLLAAIEQTAPPEFINGLRLVLTADEEIGCIGANRLIAADLIRPKRAIVGEPTSLHPARAGKGYCLAEITMFGQEAHSALPHKGESAIYRAARLITKIEELGLRLTDVQNDFFSPGFATLNIGTIQGGTAKNIIPGKCTFQLEWRPIPAQSHASDVRGRVIEILEEQQASDPNLRWELEVIRQQSGFETPVDSQLIRSIEALSGRQATSIPFASEASLFSGIAEEVVVFGPGDMQTAHSRRECVPLAELEKAVVICKSLVTSRARA